MTSSPVWRPLSRRGRQDSGAGGLPWAPVSDISPSLRNRKHVAVAANSGQCSRNRGGPAVLRPAVIPGRVERESAMTVFDGNDGVASVFCDRTVSEVDDRFCKRKLQHDLAFVIGHFEDRIQKATLRAFGLQQLPDHYPCNFPGAIGIAQLFAFGIGDQLVADTGVEEISRHGSKSTSV